MNIDRETLIKLAREAELPIAWISETGVITWSDLERFAALVLEHGRKPMSESEIVQWAFSVDGDLGNKRGIQAMVETSRLLHLMKFARAIEAAHGITNKESSDAE